MKSSKYYVFTEWRSVDCGGMDVKEFSNHIELKDWLKENYTNVVALEIAIKNRTLRIIEGEEIIPKITEKEIIKEISL
jgi:hypothetical protein